MFDEIVKLALTNGLWAVLFVLLFLYQIKSSTVREAKYQMLLEQLAKSVAIIKNVDKTVRGVARNVDIILTVCKGEKSYEQTTI